MRESGSLSTSRHSLSASLMPTFQPLCQNNLCPHSCGSPMTPSNDISVDSMIFRLIRSVFEKFNHRRIVLEPPPPGSSAHWRTAGPEQGSPTHRLRTWASTKSQAVTTTLLRSSVAAGRPLSQPGNPGDIGCLPRIGSRALSLFRTILCRRLRSFQHAANYPAKDGGVPRSGEQAR